MMNNPDEDIETLTKLGLNGVQARAYLTLLRIGPSKAKEVAKASNIARPDIYRTITKLHELSLVEKIIATPAKFKALPITEAMNMLFRRKEMENSKLRKNAASLVSRYKENGENTTAVRKERNQFILIPKKEPIVVNTKSLAETTQESICYVIPLKKLLPLMINYSEIFHHAIERKVKIMIITEKNENEAYLMKSVNELNKSPFFELRMVTSPITVHFGVFDNQKILLSTSAKSQFSEAPAIFSNNPDIIDLAKNYFEIEWATAIETKTKRPATAN